MTDVKPKVRLVDLPLKRLRPKQANEDKLSIDILVARSGRAHGHITLKDIEKLAKRRRTSVGELIRHLLIKERRNQLYGDFAGREPLLTDPPLAFGSALAIKIEDAEAEQHAVRMQAIDQFYEDDDPSIDSTARH